MTLQVTILANNAAFDEALGRELARILRFAADAIEPNEGTKRSFALHDLNGNRVGQVDLS